jgi:hypothetical protein
VCDMYTWQGQGLFMKDKPACSSETMLHKDYDRTGSVPKRNSDHEPHGAWLVLNRQSWSNSDCDFELLVESVESCSCEKWEAGSWGRDQFGNREEEEHMLLEATTKQQLVKTEKTLCVL